jgi:hypothetical protein
MVARITEEEYAIIEENQRKRELSERENGLIKRKEKLKEIPDDSSEEEPRVQTDGLFTKMFGSDERSIHAYRDRKKKEYRENTKYMNKLEKKEYREQYRKEVAIGAKEKALRDYPGSETLRQRKLSEKIEERKLQKAADNEARIAYAREAAVLKARRESTGSRGRGGFVFPTAFGLGYGLGGGSSEGPFSMPANTDTFGIYQGGYTYPNSGRGRSNSYSSGANAGSLGLYNPLFSGMSMFGFGGYSEPSRGKKGRRLRAPWDY